MLIEELESPLRRSVPVSINAPGVAPHAAQFGLQRTRKIVDRLLWLVESSDLLLFFLRLSLGSEPCLLVGSCIFLGGKARLFCRSGFLLFQLPCLFSGYLTLFRGPNYGSGFG